MPQEFHVLRCYSCSLFQVHIVKKSTKWHCKVCNEKQSLKKVYNQGTGKECRLHVQKLNSLSVTSEEKITLLECSSAQYEKNIDNSGPNCFQASPNDEHERTNVASSCQESKWSRYIEVKQQDVGSDPEESYNAENPLIKRKKYQPLKHKDCKKNTKTDEDVSDIACHSDSLSYHYGAESDRFNEMKQTPSRKYAVHMHENKIGQLKNDDAEERKRVSRQLEEYVKASATHTFAIEKKIHLDKNTTGIHHSEKSVNRWSKYLVPSKVNSYDSPVNANTVIQKIPLGHKFTENPNQGSINQTSSNIFKVEELNDQELDDLLKL